MTDLSRFSLVSGIFFYKWVKEESLRNQENSDHRGRNMQLRVPKFIFRVNRLDRWSEATLALAWGTVGPFKSWQGRCRHKSSKRAEKWRERKISCEKGGTSTRIRKWPRKTIKYKKMKQLYRVYIYITIYFNHLYICEWLYTVYISIVSPVSAYL